MSTSFPFMFESTIDKAFLCRTAMLKGTSNFFVQSLIRQVFIQNVMRNRCWNMLVQLAIGDIIGM
ncbi:hypothetical protein [Anaerocolumna sp.]|uniref:hypothetical protein n=1 Tax=Anaerocolumna sp. TaxID=2041569 RepID=UPI0028AC27DB|nr:hypothetical protein [Anaerocolumna sp.]